MECLVKDGFHLVLNLGGHFGFFSIYSQPAFHLYLSFGLREIALQSEAEGDFMKD